MGHYPLFFLPLLVIIITSNYLNMNLFVMTWSIKGNFSDLVEPANEHSLTRKVKYENSNKNSSMP